ncbi:MAG: D-alanyl-D-alanine carboxypeptidase family protein [Burkholderiaceae bacterium]|nr:D-alanyl-D-alanine carboxypeptidase family protein [Burkholderiaceae bacterium]
MKKFFAFVVAALLLFSSAQAQSLPPPTVAAKSWLLLDLNSGQMLASNDPHARAEPASLTKLMTAYIVFGAIRDKKLELDQTVTVSEHAWKVDGSSSKMFIDPKTPVTINDLLLGLIVQSGNDAAVALAEATAGSEEAFVTLMNREAERMGMNETRFANPHGLPHANNYSTAYDLSLLAAHLIADHPEFYKLYSTKEFTYNKIRQQNRNRLLWLDSTVDGLKTGHTEGAGYCLIASAKRPSGSGERRMLTVVLGTSSDQMRAQESLKLLNWGFSNFDTIKLYPRNHVLATLEIWKGSKGEVRVGFKRETYVSVPKGTASRMKPVLEYREPLLAPIQDGSQIATLKMMVDGKSVGELPVQALESVNHASVFGRAWDSIRLWIKY